VVTVKIEFNENEVEILVKSIDTEMQIVCRSILTRQNLKGEIEEINEYYERLEKKDREYLKQLEKLQEKIKKEW